MSISDLWINTIVATMVGGVLLTVLGGFHRIIWRWIANWWRKVRRPRQTRFFSHKSELGLYVILSALPYRAPTKANKWSPPGVNYVADVFDNDHRYVLGRNEVGFLFSALPALGRLVPSGTRPWIDYALDALTYNDDHTTAGLKNEIRQSNMLILGSCAYNAVTYLVQEAIQEKSGGRLRFIIPREGGRIDDMRTHKEYSVRKNVSGQITVDYGIITKLQNPWSQDKTIFIIAGVMNRFQEGLTDVFEEDRRLQLLEKNIKEMLEAESKSTASHPSFGNVKYEYWEALVCQTASGDHPMGDPHVVAASAAPVY